MNVILLGPPGAGKGTQATRLKTLLAVPHIASGDLFRAIRRENTPEAREVRAYMDRGEYVPDGLTIDLVLRRLHEPDTRAGFILDGFPRTEPQAEALDEKLGRRHRQVDVALYITAPTEVLVDRVSSRLVCPNCGAIYNSATNPPAFDSICDVCGRGVERRTDEDPNVVRVRLNTYRDQTQPLVDYYRQRGILVEVDGARPIDEVEMTVDRALGLDRVQ